MEYAYDTILETPYLAEKATLFDNIVNICHDLAADKVLKITKFGEDEELTLYITKDSNYKGKDDWDLVSISTFEDGEAVDDTGDTYVTDGCLWHQLERIWLHRGFSTL